MNAYPDITINAILPRHNSFHESLDQFLAEFENGLNRVGRREYEGWGDDCAGIYGRDGGDLIFEVTSDTEAWEWY